MMGPVTKWFASRWRGRAAGRMLIGNGLGIIISGFLVPRLNVHFGDYGWRTAWLVLGILALVTSCAAGMFLCNSPSIKNQKPMGVAASNEPVLLVTQKQRQKTHSAQSIKPKLMKLGLLYLLFGASYAVYVTFIVTALVDERGFSEQTARGGGAGLQ